MPEHHRINIGGTSDRPLRISMKVRSTDAYGLNPDLNFARPGIFNCHFRDPEFRGAMSSAALISSENDTPVSGVGKAELAGKAVGLV